MATINRYYPESVTHPGEILSETLEELTLGSKELAVRTGKPEKTISAILKGKSAITPDMAVLLEQVLEIPSHFWLEAQKNFDEYNARINYQKVIHEAIGWAVAAPYAAMARFNWVEKTRKAEEKVINLFNFFGVANIKGWEDYYLNQKTKVAFRISLKNNENATSIAAWLRQGEIQASKISTGEFSKQALKEILPEIKNIMAHQPNDFFGQLQNVCLKVGLKVVYTPCLPKTAIHGSTRWIDETPLIQMSGRWKRNDVFWFTFFHEIGHILLHGKKYISIENISDYDGEIEEFELEADSFAANWLLSEEEEEEIISEEQLNDDIIKEYAKKFSTHPAVIIGRLHHKGVIGYEHGRVFFKSLNFDINT